MSRRQAAWSEWGEVEYVRAYQRQLTLVDGVHQGEAPETIVTVVHPHVITVGRRKGSQNNIFNALKIPVVEVERGGDVTYHGPGQVVCYPIVQLQEDERDLHAFLRNIEEAVILTLRDFGLQCGREKGKTGVWHDGRKLASIGIACRKWVTFHGVALNVSTDLSYFSQINPCGFDPDIMSSVERELGTPVDSDSLKSAMVAKMMDCLGREPLNPRQV